MTNQLTINPDLAKGSKKTSWLEIDYFGPPRDLATLERKDQSATAISHLENTPTDLSRILNSAFQLP